MLATNNTITNIPIPVADQKRKREFKVKFTKKGLSDSCYRILTPIDIQMATEQEGRPRNNNRPCRQMIELGSASSWGAPELTAFRVKLVAQDSLPNVVLPFMPEIGRDYYQNVEPGSEEWTKNRICKSDALSC